MHAWLRRSLIPVALLGAACSDSLTPERPAAPALEPIRPAFTLVAPPAVCASVEESQKTVNTLLPQIFGPGQGRRGKAQGYSNNIVQARRNGDTETEQAYVDSLINYTLENYYAGNLIGNQSEETQVRVLNFFYALYCASGIEPIPDLSYIFTAENTRLLRNSTPTTTVGTDSAAVEVEAGEVPDDVFGTFVSVIRADGPLPTSLDWYGVDGYRQGAFEFIANPPVTFDSPVLTGVCIRFDDAVVSSGDLRLAHGVEPGYTPDIPGNSVVTTAGGTIEIAGYADPSPLGLACDPLPPPPAQLGRLGRLWQRLASVVVPSLAFAEVVGGSTGGTVRKFSPFAAVDIRLQGAGTGPASPQYIPVGSTEVAVPVAVTVTTRNGDVPVDGITVDFAPGGSFAPASGETDATGAVSSSWTIGEGENAGTATAPPPLVFVAPVEFSVTGIPLTALTITTASLPGGQETVGYGPVALAAEGGAGEGSHAWSLAPGSSLPSGLALSASGVLSGTPTVHGSFTFTVRVTSGPLSADATLSISIAHPPVVIVTGSPLPGATVGLPYSQAVQASGGDGSYSWSLTAGSVPSGLAFFGSGVLSGTPTEAGTSSFTVEAGSVAGTLTASKALSLTVAYPGSFGSFAFEQVPGSKQCNAVNAIIQPLVVVKVTAAGGLPLAGVQVSIVAVNNNGARVAVSQPHATSGADGRAVFNALSINKAGAYRLVAAAGAPWPAASIESGKFNISPGC